MHVACVCGAGRRYSVGDKSAKAGAAKGSTVGLMSDDCGLMDEEMATSADT